MPAAMKLAMSQATRPTNCFCLVGDAMPIVNCCLTSALSGPREARPARRRRDNRPRACGALAQTYRGPLQRIVRWHVQVVDALTAITNIGGVTSVVGRNSTRIVVPLFTPRTEFDDADGGRRLSSVGLKPGILRPMQASARRWLIPGNSIDVFLSRYAHSAFPAS